MSEEETLLLLCGKMPLLQDQILNIVDVAPVIERQDRLHALFPRGADKIIDRVLIVRIVWFFLFGFKINAVETSAADHLFEKFIRGFGGDSRTVMKQKTVKQTVLPH